MRRALRVLSSTHGEEPRRSGKPLVFHVCESMSSEGRDHDGWSQPGEALSEIVKFDCGSRWDLSKATRRRSFEQLVHKFAADT